MSKNAIAVRESAAVASMADIMATDGMWEKVCKMGDVLAASGFIGEKVSRAGAIAAAMTMVSEGLNPVEFKRRYHIIGSTPSRTPGSLLGDFQQMGGTWKIVRADDEVCEVEFRLGEQSYTSKVTMDRMLQTKVPFGRDGQLKDNWANFPDDMLWARCCAKGLRRVAPSLMGGVYTKEEVQDFDGASVRASVNENEMRYRAAMQKGPSAPVSVLEAKPECPAERAYDVEDVKDAEIVVDAEAEPPAEEQTESDAASADPCFDVCPIDGAYHGVRFADMEVDILACLVLPETISKHPELTDGHVAEVRRVISEKEAANA